MRWDTVALKTKTYKSTWLESFIFYAKLRWNKTENYVRLLFICIIETTSPMDGGESKEYGNLWKGKTINACSE